MTRQVYDPAALRESASSLKKAARTVKTALPPHFRHQRPAPRVVLQQRLRDWFSTQARPETNHAPLPGTIEQVPDLEKLASSLSALHEQIEGTIGRLASETSRIAVVVRRASNAALALDTGFTPGDDTLPG